MPVPALATVARSLRPPVPIVSVSPAEMFSLAATAILVAPAIAAVDRVVCVAALPTAVTVACS